MNMMNSICKLRIHKFSKYYSKSHEWIQLTDKPKLYKVGISDYAQDQLGGVVYLSFPDTNTIYKRNEVLAEIESPKAVSSIYAPVDIKITELNERISDDYSVINTDAENTWLFKGEVENENDLKVLMDSDTYKEFLKKQNQEQ